MKKVAFYTLGCKLNFSETSTISRMFEKKGYQKAEFTDRPDIYIINTCSVTENADKKCRKVVKEARNISPDAYIAIIGCYAQLKPKSISEIPGVDAVLGAAEKFRLIELLDGFIRKPTPEVHATEIQNANSFSNAWSLHDRTRTFLKVQDGCDYSCSFCTIPLARGKSRSNSIGNVVDDATAIGKQGVNEIVLTGVNTGDFGIINGERKEYFIDLIKALDHTPGIKRFRISSIEPNLLTDEIIDFVAHSNKFVPHFHIPLQSGTDQILKKMQRRYLTDTYISRVKKIKTMMPDCCIGVDVIVGFPGETEKDFLDTYHFLNELDISYLHVFTYSERENTLAATLPGVVEIKERNRRSKMLRSLSEKKRRFFYESQLGNIKEVLFEQEVKDGLISGFTDNYIRVSTPYDPMLTNTLCAFRLNSIAPNGEFVEGEEVVINTGYQPNNATLT